MSKQAVDIIDDYQKSIDLSQTIISSSNDGTNTTIEVGNTYHLRAGMYINVDTVDYKVISVSGSLVVFQGVVVAPLLATIPTPFYFHGTPYNTNVLLGTISNSNDKAPMLYLHEILKDRKITKPDSINDREITLRLFFLDVALGNWTTPEHYDNVIDRISKYVDKFEDDLENYYLFNGENIEFIDRIPHADFGKYMDSKGYVSSIFDETFSGIELKLTIPVLKNLSCN